MKKKLAITLSLFNIMSSSIALADSKFDGFYAGAQAGYVDGNDKGKEYLNGTFDDWTQKTNPDSGLIGAFAGYNKTLENNFVAGFEVDYEYHGGDDKSYQKFNGVPDTTYQTKTKMKDAASIRAKLGYLFNQGDTLAYLTAGYAAANIKRTFTDLSITDSESHSKWHDGWTVGFGAEHFANEKISIKAEYRYSDYGRETISTAQVYGTGYQEKQKYQDEQSIRVGVAYHF